MLHSIVLSHVDFPYQVVAEAATLLTFTVP